MLYDCLCCSLSKNIVSSLCAISANTMKVEESEMKQNTPNMGLLPSEVISIKIKICRMCYKLQ